MTITEYLASADYYLDPDINNETGEVKATKKIKSGSIVVRNDNTSNDWRVIQFSNQATMIGFATFQTPHPSAFIAYLRALENA